MARTPASRFLIPCYGSDPEPVRKALGLLKELHDQQPFPVATLLVGALSQLDEGTVLGGILGARRMKVLQKNRALNLWPGLVLEAHTKQTIRNTGAHEVVIALYAHDETMDIVDGIPGLRIAIAVPWTNEGIHRWKQTWNPPAGIAAPGAAMATPPALIQNSAVVDALKRLTSRINLSTGLAHASDKADAERVLWDLWKAGDWVEPELIRAWAVQNGWRPHDADNLMRVAEKTTTRKTAPRE